MDIMAGTFSSDTSVEGAGISNCYWNGMSKSGSAIAAGTPTVESVNTIAAFLPLRETALPKELER